MQGQKNKVMGLRVQGHELFIQQVEIDDGSFQKCPIAHAAGIPLYVKRLFNEPRIKSNNYIIVRMMSDPAIGLAPNNWQYGGSLEAAPTVLVARSDGISFDIADWYVLDEFEMDMLDDGPRNVTRNDFQLFAKRYPSNRCNLILEALYPKGAKCKVKGLKQKVELNDQIGICNGSYQKGRVGLKIVDFENDFAIKPDNLSLVSGK